MRVRSGTLRLSFRVGHGGIACVGVGKILRCSECGGGRFNPLMRSTRRSRHARGSIARKNRNHSFNLPEPSPRPLLHEFDSNLTTPRYRQRPAHDTPVMSMPRLFGLCRALLATALLIGTGYLFAQTNPAHPLVTQTARDELDALLSAELQRVVNAQTRIEGQQRKVTVQARLDPATRLIVIDLSTGYVPRFYGGEMEDRLQQLSNTALELVRDVVPASGVAYRYGGKELSHYFPEEADPRARWKPEAP